MKRQKAFKVKKNKVLLSPQNMDFEVMKEKVSPPRYCGWFLLAKSFYFLPYVAEICQI
jgi:hypothetical protein